MRLGIIGLPNSGKTTVFNALTGRQQETGAVSSGKLEIIEAVVNVPDERVDILKGLFNPKKTTYSTIVYADIGGIDKGIGEGLSGPLRNALAQSDGFLHVVRAFEDENVPHPYVDVDAQRDLDTIETEFLLVDLVTIEKRLDRLAEELKKGAKVDKRANAAETELLERLKAHLEDENPLRDLDITAEERKMISGYGLLTLKPMVVVVNMGETLRPANDLVQYNHDKSIVLGLQGQIEAEIAQLEGEDREMFLAEYNIEKPGSARVINESYKLMNIQSFFTVGEDEVRAWTIPVGATAPQAAGTIHSDLQRGFIRAEVTPYEALVELGNMTEVKAKGKMRMEGKEYIVQDGDIMNIRFNV